MCGLAGFSSGIPQDKFMPGIGIKEKRNIAEAFRVAESIMMKSRWKSPNAVPYATDRLQIASDLLDLEPERVTEIVQRSPRFMLTDALGVGVDMRGGDAIGYASMTASGKIVVGRKLGTWERAHHAFVGGAANANLCMLHARFATCGNKADVGQAHPYLIRREGKTILAGAHNGVISDADDSAKEHGRKYTVDSRELFELLADGEIDRINKLHGYGVITWMTPGQHHVNLVRMSESSEIVVCRLERGGIVWASTWNILKEALDTAGLEVATTFKLDEIGRVYEIYEDNVLIGDQTGIKLSERWSYGGWNGDYSKYYTPSAYGDELSVYEADWQKYLKKMREDDEKDEVPDTERLFSDLPGNFG